MVKSLLVVVMTALGVTATGCSPPAIVFRDKGVADTSTVTFDLSAGAYTLDYVLADRDPLLGCSFGASLVRQPPDPLAPGLVVDKAEPVTVPARGESSGRFLLSARVDGTHYLRVAGTCAWEVALAHAEN